jgi:hypothetical protein
MDMPMRHLPALLLALGLALPAHAQTVQKCVSRDGQARYQSEPCARGSRTAEVWDAAPDPVETSPAASRRATPRARTARQPRRGVRVANRQLASAPDSCEQARAYRDEAERRAGLARNYDLLSTLQRRVYDACR